MSEKPVVTDSNGSSIKVGSTGTISTLMCQELEATKHSPQASSSSQRKLQSSPVSVPCGFISKKAQQRRSPSNEASSNNSNSSSSSSSSSNSKSKSKSKNKTNTDPKSTGDADKPRFKLGKIGSSVPMLGSEDVNIDRKPIRDSKLDKKGQAHIVQVVDIKCNNPVSSRLKKFGFSKLSESLT